MTAELHAGHLVPSLHIDTFLAQRAQVLALMREACAKLLEADRLAAAAGFGSQWVHLTTLMERCRYSRYQEGNSADPTGELIAAYEKGLDACGWDHLLKETGLRTFMDNTAREQWDESLRKREAPPLTADNIGATFQTLHGARGDMVERGVLALFRGLSWDYKTNQPFRFGKRLVVGYVRSSYNTGRHKLDDLVRAFCVFDGKPEPDHRQSIGARVQHSWGEPTGEAENEYIHVRWFKNGNGHVTFKRPDLVDKLNAVLAKHYPGALPAPR